MIKEKAPDLPNFIKRIKHLIMKPGTFHNG